MQPSQTASVLGPLPGPCLAIFRACTAWVPTSGTATADTTQYRGVYLLQPTLDLAPSHLSTLPDSRTAQIKVRARKVSDPTTAPFSRICRPILEGIVSWSRTACMYCTLLHPVGGCTIYVDYIRMCVCVFVCVCNVCKVRICLYLHPIYPIMISTTKVGH